MAQPSALTGSQGVHAPPPVPQVATERALQVEPAQHPSGQPVPSQTQLPATQCCPVSHGGAVPHWHAPVAEHRSAARRSQGTHAVAPTPHDDSDGWWQVEPEQHPPAQFEELQLLHTPPLQVAGAVQGSQASPPAPQAASVRPERHRLPEQQPPHDRGSHTHVPPAHRWPAPQGGPMPHWQAPVEAQLLAVARSQAVQVAPPVPHDWNVRGSQTSPSQQPEGHEPWSQTQVPAAQRWPGPQAAVLPQRHPPSEQESARWESQAVQTPPAVPHAAGDAARHFRTASQQPVGQVVGSQVQTPPSQRCPPSHAGPSPHAHCPTGEQRSAATEQSMQVEPLTPHAVSVDGVVQVVPAQHPAHVLPHEPTYTHTEAPFAGLVQV